MKINSIFDMHSHTTCVAYGLYSILIDLTQTTHVQTGRNFCFTSSVHRFSSKAVSSVGNEYRIINFILFISSHAPSYDWLSTCACFLIWSKLISCSEFVHDEVIYSCFKNACSELYISILFIGILYRFMFAIRVHWASIVSFNNKNELSPFGFNLYD